MLTRSGLTYPEVSSKVYHDSFCQLGRSISLPWAIYFEAFYLHIVSSVSCIPVICSKFVLFLIHLQFVHLFCAYYILIMPKKCLNHPDNLCYVFGELTFKSQRQNVIPLITKCYDHDFGRKVGHQDKSWAPHICCLPCVRLLIGWVNGSHQMPLAVPMV